MDKKKKKSTKIKENKFTIKTNRDDVASRILG